MRKSIGGYLELTLADRANLHQQALAVNSGRNGLRYLLRVKKYSKIYIPYFTCDVVLNTIEEEGVPYEFYKIDSDLEPIFDWSVLEEFDGFLYTNYFGVKDAYANALATKIPNCILDNAQALYANPISGSTSFYSPRKFIGIPDGGFVYCDPTIVLDEQDVSYERMQHLVKRLDVSAEEGYCDFVENEKLLATLPLKKMSTLTSALLNNVEHTVIKELRRRNYNLLYEKFRGLNKLDLPLDATSVPLVFPLWIDKEVKSTLHQHRCYTPTYWPNVLEWVGEDFLEYQLTRDVVYLPIDQTIGLEDLKTIISRIETA